MAKRLMFRSSAREKVLSGASQLADTIRVTLGPKSDATRNEYVDLYEAGIVDPTKVMRIALENAVSVASVLLLTEATMTDFAEKPEQLMPSPEMNC